MPARLERSDGEKHRRRTRRAALLRAGAGRSGVGSLVPRGRTHRPTRIFNSHLKKGAAMENSLLMWLLGLANGLILLLVGIAVRGITAINSKFGTLTVEIEKSKTWQAG